MCERVAADSRVERRLGLITISYSMIKKKALGEGREGKSVNV
eukprot:SAG11_NODE_678_length_7786_cov_10.991804_4_plen_42_part_00